MAPDEGHDRAPGAAAGHERAAEAPGGATGPRSRERFLTIVLALLTVVAAGLFLTALAGGFAGWAWIAGPVALVLAVLTLLVMRDARRRRNDPIVYTPDNERP